MLRIAAVAEEGEDRSRAVLSPVPTVLATDGRAV
jgi:hypothetical protein